MEWTIPAFAFPAEDGTHFNDPGGMEGWFSPEAPETQKLALAKTNTKLQNPGLVTFYDIQPGNGADLFW